MAAVSEITVWGIHAGRTGDAHALFHGHSVIALGWPRMGDLSELPADREAYKEKIKEAYPNAKPGAIPINAGQLFRFVHEMSIGDLVVYRSKVDRKINIGRVEGGYAYQPHIEPSYPHHRAVKWLNTFARTHFTQGALYEIGSALSFFQVKNYADEFVAAIEGKAVPPPVAEDETVGIVAEEIEQTTRDFILKRLAQELKGHPFAEFVAHLLASMGYRTRLSPEGPDGGIDIIAHKDELGFEPPIIKVQVKSGEGSVGDPVVSALSGKLDAKEYGLIVTLGSFTHQAKNFARGRSNLRLIDGDELVDLVLQHYDQFDARYKGLLPLRRVYIPEPVEEVELLICLLGTPERAWLFGSTARPSSGMFCLKWPAAWRMTDFCSLPTSRTKSTEHCGSNGRPRLVQEPARKSYCGCRWTVALFSIQHLLGHTWIAWSNTSIAASPG